MECMEYQKSIRSFLSEKMDDSDLNDFLNHTDSCAACREELELEYIVDRGPGIIDDPAGDYDIPKVFRRYIESGKRYIRFRKISLVIRYVVDTLAFWAVLFSVFKLFFILR